jgi:hypothetical protein
VEYLVRGMDGDHDVAGGTYHYGCVGLDWSDRTLADPLPSLAGLAGGTLPGITSGVAEDGEVDSRGINSSRLENNHGRP